MLVHMVNLCQSESKSQEETKPAAIKLKGNIMYSLQSLKFNFILKMIYKMWETNTRFGEIYNRERSRK